MVLHLSRLPPPGAQAHHRRIAATVMEDTASRQGGQVFALANGDVAMLFRPQDGGEAVWALLAKLFQAQMPEPATLRSMLALPEQGLQALEFVRGAVGGVPAPGTASDTLVSVREMAAMEAALQQAPITGLAGRQTALLLRPGSAVPMTPVYREVSISTAALVERAPAGEQMRTDPFLFGHLTEMLDRRMIAAMVAGGPERSAMTGGMNGIALHVNMSVGSILSSDFVAFVEAMQRVDGLRLGIEVHYPEVFADAKSFLLARERVRQTGLRLVLDGVEANALSVSAPWRLQPDLVKLAWSPALAECGDRVRETVQAMGEMGVVLHRAESEQALRWGLRHGIALFQGYYVDTMMAAERLRACSGGTVCTLGECRARAFSISGAVRAGCRDHAMLDSQLARPAA